MIADAQRGPRDVLRTRLRLVERRRRCKNSLDRLLEKFNVLQVTGHTSGRIAGWCRAIQYFPEARQWVPALEAQETAAHRARVGGEGIGKWGWG